MKYSFIIPTYNRLEELKDLLPSVDGQDFDKSELEMVIVDDGSIDQTKAFIEEYKSAYPIIYLSQTNKGPGAARNYGMTKATGEYFLFVDSDCILPSDYLSKIDEHLTSESPDAFGGPDTAHPSFSPLLKAINYSMTSFLGTGGTRGSTKSVAKFYPRSFNMGFHNRVFKTIGGFGSLRHGQDMDYSARIFAAGFKVTLVTNAFVFHKRRTSLKKFFKQIYNWGIARINLSQLHEGFLKPVHLIPATILLASLILIILFIFKVIPQEGIVVFCGMAGIVALIAFFQSLKMYGNLKIAFLSIITLFTQVLAYGLGSLSGLFQRFILRRKESKGFVKNYYK